MALGKTSDDEHSCLGMKRIGCTCVTASFFKGDGNGKNNRTIATGRYEAVTNH